MKWAPGMRFRFKAVSNLGGFAGCIGCVRSDEEVLPNRYKSDGNWWFTLEDRTHPDYSPDPRWHVGEEYMEPVYPESGFTSVEEADAWLDSYTSAESSS